MTGKFVGIVFVTAVAAFTSQALFVDAQTPAPGQAPGGGRSGQVGSGGPPQGRGGPPPGVAVANAPQQIDQTTAKRMAEAAQAAAVAAGASVAIAVVDANTDLVHFIRMDGVASRAVEASQGKARATLLFGVPTRLIGESIAAGQPIPVKVTPTGTQGIPIWTVQGGLPIVRDGKIIGAIGVGGSTSAQDEKFAQAGIDTLQAR